MSNYPLFSDEYFMKIALDEAKTALTEDEIPVGAVIVYNNRVIAKAHNLTEKLNDVTAHAEMQAITAAAEAMGGKFLNDAKMYVTLEPCVMCAGACAWSRLSEIIYGAPDDKRGFLQYSNNILHPKTSLKGGVLEEECSILIKNFFETKRRKAAL